MVTGRMVLRQRKMALQYSIPRRLFGDPRRRLNESSLKQEHMSMERRALFLAWAQLKPSFNPSRRRAEKSGLSSDKIFAAAWIPSRFPSSLPKQRWVTAPSRLKRFTPQAAKSSALLTAKTEGSSITRSAPPIRAIFVRRYLSKTAGSPRWTKSPLITTMQ